MLCFKRPCDFPPTFDTGPFRDDMKILFIIPLILLMSIPIGMYVSIPYIDVMFENDVNIQKKNNTYLVARDFTVLIDDEAIFVPKNFETDLPTIPFAIKPGPEIAPYVLHAFLYECPESFSRDEVDVIFYQSLRSVGFTKWRSFIKYFIVKLYARSHFNEGATCYEQPD